MPSNSLISFLNERKNHHHPILENNNSRKIIKLILWLYKVPRILSQLGNQIVRFKEYQIKTNQITQSWLCFQIKSIQITRNYNWVQIKPNRFDLIWFGLNFSHFQSVCSSLLECHDVVLEISRFLKFLKNII